jgi:uncharacterized protein
VEHCFLILKSMSRVFLTAEWRDLVMLNYEIAPSLLHQYVPSGVELDFYDGRTFVSLVGFRFLRTKVFGFSIPLHRNFEEVNLRFYVRRLEGQGSRRGVVFIREIVPRLLIAKIARAFYNENYVARPMSHCTDVGPSLSSMKYLWKSGQVWNRVQATVNGLPTLPEVGSLEQFITEHYWGYSEQRDGSCMEYHVEHEPWKVWVARNAAFEGDVKDLYGPDVASVLKQPAYSSFLAEGSNVIVYCGRRLDRQ